MEDDIQIINIFSYSFSNTSTQTHMIVLPLEWVVLVGGQAQLCGAGILFFRVWI